MGCVRGPRLMRRRRERNLTSDEVALWTQVARTVRPFERALEKRWQPPESMAALLDGAAPASSAAPAVAARPSRKPPRANKEDAAREQAAQQTAVASRAPDVPPARTLPPLVALERRTLTALRRGQQPLEAVIDLHGLRQSDAHDRLRSFLISEQHRGARLVLVITGKGGGGASVGGDERGVLKRAVPHWLRMADLRATVLGFEDASLNHGGSGALYVRLRRLKETKQR